MSERDVVERLREVADSLEDRTVIANHRRLMREAAAEIRRLRVVLHEVEYSERWTEQELDGGGSRLHWRTVEKRRCPMCACSPHQGHRPDCTIARALAAYARPPEAPR